MGHPPVSGFLVQFTITSYCVVRSNHVTAVRVCLTKMVPNDTIHVNIERHKVLFLHLRKVLAQ